jgi:nucleotide-binding universal stress UspA family protein
MYARILAGVDASAHAEHALQHAVELAKARGAALDDPRGAGALS